MLALKKFNFIFLNIINILFFFFLAANLLGIRIRYVDVDPLTCAVNIKKLKKAITSDTCLVKNKNNNKKLN